jgi:hypothetical protein
MKRVTMKVVLAVIFILSGGCGLIYQIVWFKFLSPSLGNTTVVQMIVLSTFRSGRPDDAVIWHRGGITDKHLPERLCTKWGHALLSKT